MVAKAQNGHFNIQELFKLNFIATYYNISIRSPEKDSEKNMVLCKKTTKLPHLAVPVPNFRINTEEYRGQGDGWLGTVRSQRAFLLWQLSGFKSSKFINGRHMQRKGVAVNTCSTILTKVIHCVAHSQRRISQGQGCGLLCRDINNLIMLTHLGHVC